MVDTCHVTGTLIAPDGSPLPRVAAMFQRLPERAFVAGDSTAMPHVVRHVTSETGAVSVHLVPGPYLVRLQGASYPPFRIDVPDEPTANLADIQDDILQPPPSRIIEAVDEAKEARDEAVGAKGAAEEAAARAEAARAAARTIFPDTAAGLAATTDGDYFSVPSEDDEEYLILYRNNNGTAEEVARYPSAEGMTVLADETEGYRRAGDPIQPNLLDLKYAWSVVDSEGHAALGLTPDGKTEVADLKARDVEAVSFQTNLLKGNELDLPAAKQVEAHHHEYAYHIEDSDGNVAFGIRHDGLVDLTPGPTFRIRRTPERFGGVFQGQMIYINNAGQSLGLGAAPPQTTEQEYDNMQVHTEWDPPFRPATTGFREKPTYGAMGAIKELIANENGIPLDEQDYRLFMGDTAVSNKDIDALSKGGETGAYEAALDQVKAVKGYADVLGKDCLFAAVTWTQGEAGANEAAESYAAKLEKLIDDFNEDAKSLTGQKQDIILITYQTNSAINKGSALGQWRASLEHPHIYMACPTYFLNYPSDFQHIDGPSTKWLGGYYGIVYKRVVIDRKRWEPLQPSGVQAIGNTVVITFNKGGLVFDTDLMPQQTNYGFSVVNESDQDQTISDVELLPGGRVRLTLSAPPASGWRVQYGLKAITGKEPFVGGGGNLRDRQGDFLTYFGKPMHNWCILFDWEM